MKLLDQKIVLTTRPFKVEEMRLEVKGVPNERPWHRLRTPDWVNVLPITRDRKALLIRQFRAGVLSEVLECPGGVIDPGERDPTMAAARELEEETGFTSQRLLPLASPHSNPAIIDNRIHFFLALDCVPVSDRKHFPDDDESIQVVPVEIAELDGLVRTGRVDHALCGLCIMLAMKYLNVAP